MICSGTDRNFLSWQKKEVSIKHIVFLNPPSTKEERGGSLKAALARSIPYGLISLASVMRKCGYKVSLMDATNLEWDIDRTVHEICAVNPDYIGISLVTLSVDKAAKVAEKIKSENRNLTVIVGGPHVSSIPDETMKLFPCFDIGVVGEGEETLKELLSTLDTHGPLSAVRGILYRQGDNVIKTERRPLITNLDELPLPAWDLLKDMAHFYLPSAPSYIRLPSTTIVTSRGCPGNCIFCNSKAIFGGLRCFSATYVLTMIESLVNRYGIRDISIYDDNFIFFKERVQKICNQIINKKIDITWSCYSRVNQGNFELFKLMKRAGCWQVSYGIESGSQRILDFIKKNATLDQIRHTVSQTKKAGLRTRGFFIIGHITEDKDSIMDTIRFMKEIPLDDFHFTYMTPLPGTVAYTIAKEYGTFDTRWNKMNMQYPVFIPRGLSSDEMERYSKLAYRSFYFRPRVIASYIYMLMRYPHNIKRMYNALRALLSRIFADHLEFQFSTQPERDA